MSVLDILRREQKHYAENIPAYIRSRYPNGDLPQDAKDAIDHSLARAAEIKAEADAIEGKGEPGPPVYKHDMVGLPGMPTKGGWVPGGDPGGVVPEGAYSLPLTHESKVLDSIGAGHIAEEAIWGALGVIVKAQAVPVDRREAEHFAKGIGETKDMLTTGSAGVLVPTTVAGYVIDLMRSAVVVSKLGARTVPMSSKTTTIPRITGDVTAQWLAEGATLTLSDATLDSVTLTAKRLDAGTKVSLELEEDSDPVAIGQVVSRAIAAAFALKIDAAALRGSGTDPEPRGIRFTSGVTLYAPGTNGDPYDYSVLLALVRAVSGANAIPSGFVSTPGAAVTLASLREGGATGAYMMPPPLFAQLNLGGETTTSLPSNLTKGTGTALTEVYCGDFRLLLLGMRVGMSIQTARELYRPEGKVGIFGRMRLDVGVEHGPAFAVATFVDD
jgi:HK97 family phage major capsid protein